MGRTVGASLRARLLVGVAAAAMAAPVANRALAQDAAKFAPYVEAGGMVGTHSFGDVDIFIPVWQDQTSVLFGDLRGTFSAQPTEEGNFGLGYRTQVSPEWILGGYGYFDIANSPNDNLFYQITLGVELKSVDWDFRLNGYIPINPDGSTINKNSNPDIHINGNTIKMTTESRDEKALYGFDGEVGWRVPVFPADGDFDIRVYAGGYYFTNGDVDTIAGPRGRIEARLYDIDFLGLQSRLTAQGVIQWDQPRGTQGWGGLELRIPLGAITGSASPKLNPLDRRMVDRVYRDINIVTEKTQPKTTSEDVIVDELTVSTHTIVFANSGGAGSGAKGSPIDLNAAPGKGQTLGSNAIILADGGAGNITITNPLQLSNGQALIGGGSIVPLTGAKSGKTVDFKFSGSRSTLVGTNPDADVVDMATRSTPTQLTQNEIWGINIQGTFEDGIFGANVQRAIVKNSVIAADDAAHSGIEIVQYSPNAQESSFVHVAHNSVSGAPDDGIEVNNAFSDGSHTQTVLISYNTVAVNLDHGIEQFNTVLGSGTTFTQAVEINSNVASANGFAGIEATNEVLSGGTVVQALLIDPNTVVENAYFGILVTNSAFDGGTITQGVAILDNTVENNGFVGLLDDKRTMLIGPERGGIVVTNAAFEDGNIAQAVKIDGNTVNYNGTLANPPLGVGTPQPFALPVFFGSGNGISLYNFAGDGSTIVQAGEISGNVVRGNSENGIGLGNSVTSGSTIAQSLAIAGNTVAYNHSDGIFNTNFALFGTLGQTLSIDNDVIGHNGDSGLSVDNFFITSTVNQNVTVDPTTITDHPYGNGIEILGNQSGGTLVQNIAVLNSTILRGGYDGIHILGNAEFGASVTQTVTLTGNSIANHYVGGASIFERVSSNATLLQTVVATGNSINNLSSHGLGITAAGFYGATVVQNVTVAGNTLDEISLGGIQVSAFSFNQAGSLTQNVLISGNTVLNAAKTSNESAIEVGFAASGLSTAQHNVTVVNNTVSNAGKRAIFVSAFAAATTTAVGSVVSIAGNQVSNISRYAGIFAFAAVLSGATMNQSVTITGNSVAHVQSLHGIYIVNDVNSGGTLIQAAVIDNNAASDLYGAGIFVFQHVSGTGAIMSQSLTIAGNQITHLDGAYDNRAAGILVDNRISNNATLNQTAFIDDNTISDIHGLSADGIAAFNEASGVGASLSQNLTIDSNSIAALHGVNIHLGQDGRGGYAVGIGVLTHVGSGAVATQTMTIEDNVVRDLSAGAVVDSVVSGAAVGIAVANYVSGDGRLSQAVAINNNMISEFRAASAAGIVVYSEVSGSGAFMTQALTIDPNTVTSIHGTNNVSGGYAAGVGVFTRVVSGGFASQTVSITDNSISNIKGGFLANGVYVVSHESDGTFLGSVAILDNAVSGISGGTFAAGIAVLNGAAYLGSFSQSVDIAGNAVSGVSAARFAAGIVVGNHAKSSTISQTVSITGNAVTNVATSGGRIGIYVRTQAASNGTINQNVTIADNTVTYTGEGIDALTFTYGGNASVSQAFAITGNTASKNPGQGITIVAHARSNATITQGGTVAGNTATLNGRDGIAFRTSAEDGFPATTKQTFDLTNNTVGNNDRSGIYLYARGAGATQVVTLTTSAPGNVITNNDGWGVLLSNTVTNTHQTFGANSTQIGGAGPNILSPNTLGNYLKAGVGTQVFNK